MLIVDLNFLAQARDPSAKNTESISRDHVIDVSSSGLLTIAGGKWTTYRKMAEDSVSRLVCDHPPLQQKAAHCRTREVPLLGAAGWSLAMSSVLVRMGLSTAVSEHLSHNYGDKATAVAQIAVKENATQPLALGYPFIEAEVLYGCRHEYAQTAVDVLARRVRLAFLNQEAAVQVA